MWFCKNKEPVDTEKLERKNEELQRRVNMHEDTIAAYKKRLDEEFSVASFSVDWKAMNAFSIERNLEHGVPKTIVGFMLTEPVVTSSGEGVERITEKDVVREWTLYCSHTEHQRLVAEFNKFVQGK